MRTLGVDPGYERFGVCVLEKERVIHSGCIVTDSSSALGERILDIGERFERLIKKYEPKAVALEKVFFSKNKKTALGVSEVRGAIKFIAIKNKLPVFEYSPQDIKIATTGYGNGSKKQVESMVRKILGFKKKVSYDDEIDAIAVALTHSVNTKFD